MYTAQNNLYARIRIKPENVNTLKCIKSELTY